MKIDIKKDIVIPAWNLVKDDGRIKKMQFIPGILSIILLTTILVYQSLYTYLILTDRREEILDKLINFIHSTYVIESIAFALAFILLYIIIIPIFEGALIKYISKKDVDGDLEVSESVSIGLYKFLPLFKYNNLFSEFKFLSILNGYLFILRFFDFQYIKEISYIFLAIFLFSVFINVFLSYSKYIIMLENGKVFDSIGKSSKIATINLVNTFKLYFLMFILNIRVIFNFIVFLIFPIIMMIAIGFVTTQILKTLTLIIIVVVFIGFILFLGYLTGVLEALKVAIWYYAYKRGKEKLDDIEKELE